MKKTKISQEINEKLMNKFDLNDINNRLKNFSIDLERSTKDD